MGNDNKIMTRDEILADLDFQLKQVQLEQARAGLQDTQEQLAEREMKRSKIRKDQRDRAMQLADVDRLRRAKVMACPHKKGGTDLAGFRRGDNPKRSVIRFQFPNGDYMNNCTRCGNVVLPPVEPQRVADLAEVAYLENYGFKHPNEFGIFLKEDKLGYAGAMKVYRIGADTYNEWLELPTDNIASTACRPVQTGGQINWERYYRVALHQSQQIPIFQAERWPEASKKKEAA